MITNNFDAAIYYLLLNSENISVFWSTVIGSILGFALGSLLSYLLWLIQHSKETKDRNEELLLIRKNLLMELILEIQQNLNNIKGFLAKPGHASSYKLQHGNLSLKFEMLYYKYFSFAEENLMAYKLFVTTISEYSKELAFSDDDLNEIDKFLKAYSSFFIFFNNETNNYNFVNKVSDGMKSSMNEIWNLNNKL